MKLSKIRWTPNALQDMESIRQYMADNAGHDTMVEEARKIWESCQRLRHFPDSGRPGRVPMTREVVAAPYVIPYRIKGGIVEILNVFHSAQKR